METVTNNDSSCSQTEASARPEGQVEGEAKSPASEAIPFRCLLLGRCEFYVRGRLLPTPRYRKEWWLLALLALHPTRELSRDTLAALFWPESEPDRALLYLRRSLTNLRRALGLEAGRLQSPTPRTLRLDMTDAFADVTAFDRALKNVSGRLPANRQATEAELMEAVALYEGPLLPDCPEEWAMPEREQRERAYQNALLALGQRAREQGDLTASAAWLHKLVSADACRESACMALMETLAEGGDRAAMSQAYQNLRRALRQERAADPGPETQALYGRLMEQARPSALPPPLVAAAPPVPSRRHLPVPLNDLIGRGSEIEEVTGWLQRVRLVTLLGTGGVGKTRLAIAVAEAALPRFAEGVWFADLSALTQPARVPEAVAKALGIGEEAGGDIAAKLTDALAVSSLLLVLDNCEHLLDACAGLAARLLAACPGLRVLATSRQALDVTGEQAYPVPSLQLPPASEKENSALNGGTARAERTEASRENAYAGEKEASALLEYAAVRLFVERARQANPLFRLNRGNADAIAAICRHLDGIPLALELAAARTRSLTPQEIEMRLEDRFRLLATGNRAAAPRHQTLRAAIDWSYTLLSAPERFLLHRVSIFQGGWTCEAARSVCAGGNTPLDLAQGDIVLLLAGLVDKSLVLAEASGEETRYDLLETIRQYSRERLRAGNEEPILADRHTEWALTLAENAAPHLSGADAVVWLDRLDREHANLRAALDWLARQPGEQMAERQLRTAGALLSFWIARGHYGAGRQLLDVALSRPEATLVSLPVRARALRAAAILASSQGDYPLARSLFEEVLGLRRAIGDAAGIAAALGNLGTALWLGGDQAAAAALYRESLTLYRQLNDGRGIAETLYNIGILEFELAVDADGLTAIRLLLEEAAGRFDTLGDARHKSYALNALGNLYIEQKAYRAAQAIHEENLRTARDLNDPLLIGDALAMLGVALNEQGKHGAALPLLREALGLRREMGDKRNAGIALIAVAQLFAAQGRTTTAAGLWGAIERMQEQAGSFVNPRQQIEYARIIAQARASSDAARFAAAWNMGRALTWEQAVEEAVCELE